MGGGDAPIDYSRYRRPKPVSKALFRSLNVPLSKLKFNKDKS